MTETEINQSIQKYLAAQVAIQATNVRFRSTR